MHSSPRPSPAQAARQLHGLLYASTTIALGFSLSHAVPLTLSPLLPIALCLAGLALHGGALWLHAASSRVLSAPERHAGIAAAVLSGFALNPAGVVEVNLVLIILGSLFAASSLMWKELRQQGEPGRHRSERIVEQGIGSHPSCPTTMGEPSGQQTSADVPCDADPPQLELMRRINGSREEVEATARIEFAAGQRQVSIDIAITPALPDVPEVECEPLDESDLTWSLAAAYPFGVRLDFRRAGDVQSSLVVPVGILITAARGDLRAAS